MASNIIERWKASA